MNTFSGKFEYLDLSGSAVQKGACSFTIDGADFRLIPETGPVLAMDLGDIDVYSPGDYRISLNLYTGNCIILSHLGKTFQSICHDFQEAYQRRVLQCLLLEDLEEIGRFDGFVDLDSSSDDFSGPAELRICRSNLVILPAATRGLHWRLSDIDRVDFDEAAYRLELRSQAGRIIITKLAKRTREFMDCLKSAMQDLSENKAVILHSLFPFLSPDQFMQLAGMMKEGHAIEVSRMEAVHPRIKPVLIEKTVCPSMKPYFDLLEKRLAVEEGLFSGFKMIRPEGQNEMEDVGSNEISPARNENTELEEENHASSGEHREENDDDQQQVLHWFLFPLAVKPGLKAPARVVAWEATSHSGRATYFFRIPSAGAEGRTMNTAEAKDTVEPSIQRLNRALVLLNFRREPIYLSGDVLAAQLRYRHYAIACRNLPALRELRASYLGRAIHTTPEDWEKQVNDLLARA